MIILSFFMHLCIVFHIITITKGDGEHSQIKAIHPIMDTDKIKDKESEYAGKRKIDHKWKLHHTQKKMKLRKLKRGNYRKHLMHKTPQKLERSYSNDDVELRKENPTGRGINKFKDKRLSLDMDKTKLFLEKILGIEEKARKKEETKSKKEQDKIKNPVKIPLPIKDHDSKEKETTSKPIVEKKIEKKENKKNQYKITNKPNKKIKCKWWKKKEETAKKKLKKYMNANCKRTKARTKMSYSTMWLIFQQVYKQAKLLRYIKLKKKRYSEFLSSVEDFMEKNKKCNSNRYWNPKLMEVRIK